MNDEYWKKRAAELPHYEPAHVRVNIDNLPPPQQPVPASGDIDITAMMTQRIQRQAMQQQAPVDMGHYQGPPVAVCMIRENVQAYRKVDSQSFGTTTPLVINVGPIQGVAGRQFENKGPVNCFVIDNMSTVDLSKISEQPERMIRLVQVSAPFLGTLLVPESAVIAYRPQNAGPQMLKG